jgi:hypothetical protein
MSLTVTETAVVARLRSLSVATMATLRQGLDISAVTVAAALRKYGYLTSFNHNSSFYVLADTPRFDSDGLWWHGDIGFSRHGTLQATLLALIEQAPAGCTVAELEKRLATPPGNLLSRLCSHGLVGRMSLGRCVVYLALDPARQAQQSACRSQLAAPPTPPDMPHLAPDLPPGTLIALLVQFLRSPTASPASLSKTLQARGIDITADHVRHVFDFYDIPQKKGPCLSLNWPSN